MDTNTQILQRGFLEFPTRLPRNVSKREPNQRRPQQIFDDSWRKLTPLDTHALLKFSRNVRLDYRHARRWRGQLDADIDESVKTQITIGSYQRTAQTEVLDEAIDSGDGGA
jgi:hypothetical protein